MQARNKGVEIPNDLPDLIIARGFDALREIARTLGDAREGAGQRCQRAQNLREDEEEGAAHDEKGKDDHALLHTLRALDLRLTRGVVGAHELVDLCDIVRDGCGDRRVGRAARLRGVGLYDGIHLIAVSRPARFHGLELCARGGIVGGRELHLGVAFVESREDAVILSGEVRNFLADVALLRCVRGDETRGEPRELIRAHAQGSGCVDGGRIVLELVEGVEVQPDKGDDEEEEQNEDGLEFRTDRQETSAPFYRIMYAFSKNGWHCRCDGRAHGCGVRYSAHISSGTNPPPVAHAIWVACARRAYVSL